MGSTIHFMAEPLYWIIAGIAALLLTLPLLRALAWRFLSVDQEIAASLSRTKSAEVRLGKISETLAPLLKEFPVDVHKPGTSTVFVGQPVDFIHYDPDIGISFIEVKSGNAVLSASQRQIRAHIEAGRVQWHELRIKEPVVNSKRRAFGGKKRSLR